jgi:cytochrome P450
VYASANRDEAKFPRADRFELDRENIADRVAFGRGPHHCPGAQLGRLQLRRARGSCSRPRAASSPLRLMPA